jgi:hypothetical protein
MIQRSRTSNHLQYIMYSDDFSADLIDLVVTKDKMLKRRSLVLLFEQGFNQGNKIVSRPSTSESGLANDEKLGPFDLTMFDVIFSVEKKTWPW